MWLLNANIQHIDDCQPMADLFPVFREVARPQQARGGKGRAGKARLLPSTIMEMHYIDFIK